MRFKDCSHLLPVFLITGLAAACATNGAGQNPGGDGDESSLGSTGGAAEVGGTGAIGSGGTLDGAGGVISAVGGTGGDDLGFPTGPLRPTRYRIPEPVVASPPCELTGDGVVDAYEVLLGQTHLTPMVWPFQTVSGGRPLTIAVAATGSGMAPAITATARLGQNEFTLCLTGPKTLPADTSDLETATYRGTFPSEWIQPGVEIEVAIGTTFETLSPTVVAENGITIYFLDAELFGVGTNEDTSDAQWTEFLARLPFSYIDVGINPFGVWRPTRLLIGPRDDGKSPTGELVSHGALFVDENPHCSTEDQSNATCSPHSGYGTMSAVLGTLDTFREANGVSRASTWYADLAQALGGGLAGGQRGTGDNSKLVMNHELGHAWGFPHWGSSHMDYPYEGVQRDRGGFGDRWALDQVTGLLLSPICDELERQSPMQRAGSCVPDGSWFDPFSDYEAARLLRMNLGASQEATGDVPYAGGVAGGDTRSFTLPEESGREHMVWNEGEPGFELERYDETSNAFVPYESEAWNRLAQTEVPVVMFSGAVIVGGSAHFEAPTSYVGNVLEKLDPSDPADYAVLYEKRSADFYWARDLHLRFTLGDGTIFSRIYGAEAVLRAEGDSARFAFNLPEEVGNQVTKLEVLSRPLGHYSLDSRLDETDTAENYFNDATVLGTWEK